MEVRSSLTHPLRIDTVQCSPFAPGAIGITFCPGKCGDSIHGAPWTRSLEIDLDAVKAWGATHALTLLEAHEFSMLRVEGLGDGFQRRGIHWYHLPIPDLRCPDQTFHASWIEASAAALGALKSGGKVLVHCRGGLGRAGLVGCMLLRELGAPAKLALPKVRRARPGAVETAEQERYVTSYKPLIGRGRV